MIIFDLDDTLIDTTGSITPIQLEKALHKMVEAGLQVGDFEKAAKILKKMDLSSESASQTLKLFLDRFGGNPSLLKIGEMVVYEELTEGVTVYPLQQAAKVLATLSEEHKLALVSCGKREKQLLKMKSSGLDSAIFSKIIISEKKDKKPSYQETLRELKMPPASTAVCGDRIERDLTPAKQLGCHTIHMQWGRGLSPQVNISDADFTISRLAQIPKILRNLVN